MSRLPTRFLLLLALLGALWHPLCGCAAGWSAGDATGSAESSCCATPGEPGPADPCGQPAGECECERELVLASSASEAGTGLGLPPLDLPPATVGRFERIELVTRARPAPRRAPPRPPDRCRPLPLRI